MIGRRRELAPAVPPARARHLWRAGIGAVVMAFLTIALLLIEDDALAPAAVEAQIPATEPAETIVAAEPSAASGPVSATAESAPAALASAADVPPSALPPVVDSPTASLAECAPAPVAARAPLPPTGAGFMIQLGVFGDPANAEGLREELSGQGYPAYVQSRVVLGPYASRNAAQAAHDKLRRDRRIDGMIIPPRKP